MVAGNFHITQLTQYKAKCVKILTNKQETMKTKETLKEGNITVYSVLSPCSLILLLLPEDDSGILVFGLHIQSYLNTYYISYIAKLWK